MIALESPEAMAERTVDAWDEPSENPYDEIADVIRARDEQIASWCEERAAEAQQKADGESLNASLVMSGEADAYLTIAAMLRG